MVKLEGEAKWFYESGELWSTPNYINNIQEGFTTTYYKSGAIQGIWLYQNGKLNGNSKIFYESGKLEVERNYIEGKLEGISKVYNDYGGVSLEASYKNDVLDGTSYFYYPDRSIQVIDKYINGQIVKRTRFDIVGNFTKEEEEFTEFFGDGSIKSELKFKEGSINGINKYYYLGGSIKAILNYNHEKLDSICSYYYENGVINKKLNYINGEKFGLSFEYDSLGYLISKSELPTG